MGINYGLNRVRFPAPVPVGSRVRAAFRLLAFEPLPGGAQLTIEATIDREGGAKPVCVAELVSRATSCDAMKVLLIDDHPLILAALQAVIRGLGDDVTVVGVGTDREARAALKRDPDYDLVLLDLYLGEADGFELLAELRGLYPALPIVVVSASDRASDVIRAIDAGAMGFVPKRASNETLFEALRLVMSGGIYVPPMTLGIEPLRQAPAQEGDTVPDVMRPYAHDEVDDLASAVAGETHAAAPTLARCAGAVQAPGRCAGLPAAGHAQQADRARDALVGRDRQGPCRRGAARPRRVVAHAGGAGGQPDDAARRRQGVPGWKRSQH